jgi:hypothetical protein
MPRKSPTAKIISLDTRATRLRPPADLPTVERELFARLVSACPASHFQASDAPLLAQYVANVVLNERATAELRTAPIVDGRPSPWLVVAEKSHRAVVALSLRLRLSPQARAPHAPTRREALQAPSAYDVMRLAADENEGS